MRSRGVRRANGGRRGSDILVILEEIFEKVFGTSKKGFYFHDTRPSTVRASKTATRSQIWADVSKGGQEGRAPREGSTQNASLYACSCQLSLHFQSLTLSTTTTFLPETKNGSPPHPHKRHRARRRRITRSMDILDAQFEIHPHHAQRPDLLLRSLREE